MGKVFTAAYAPSTLGSFLRSFTFGHVRQADAVASRFLLNLAEHTELLGRGQDAGTVLRRHRRHRRGGPRLRQAGRRVRLLRGAGPQRGAGHGLHRSDRAGDRRPAAAQGAARAPPRGAARLATDALALIRRSQLAGRDVLVRADSAFYSHALVAAVLTRRRRGLDHRADGPGGQTRHRRHRRGRVDHDQVPRRDLRRDHRHLDLQGPGRRDAVHRVHLPARRPTRFPGG